MPACRDAVCLTRDKSQGLLVSTELPARPAACRTTGRAAATVPAVTEVDLTGKPDGLPTTGQVIKVMTAQYPCL